MCCLKRATNAMPEIQIFKLFWGHAPFTPYHNPMNYFSPSTRIKISQLVANLQTSRQQVIFARLVTSCQQVWNKLLITCNKLVDIIRLVTRLLQQDCHNHDITILLQPFVVNLATFLLYHDCINLLEQPCNKSDNAIKLVASC